MRPRGEETRNPNNEVRNKFKAGKMQMTETVGSPVSVILILRFELVSDFELRASDFPNQYTTATASSIDSIT
jgi:hypothetical protein